MELQKEIEELQRKAGAYESLLGEVVPVVEKVRMILKDVDSMLSKLDPNGFVKSNKRMMHKPIIDKIIENLRVGNPFRYSREIIEKEFNIDTITARNLMSKVKKNPVIAVTKEGQKLLLFYKGA